MEFDQLAGFHLGKMHLWIGFQLNCMTSAGRATILVGCCMIDLRV